MCAESFGDSIKYPNVSGQFYPADSRRLSAMIDSYLSQADTAPSEKHIQILMAPHAGYIFSGPVAAHAFKAISQKSYRTVVVIAPSHYFRMNGFAVWKEGTFQTPLGPLDIDEDFAGRLLSQHQNFIDEPEAFEREHSLEVELPFLQKVLRDFKIVPIIAGQPDMALAQELADALDRLIGDRQDVLVVISTDMSHFYTASKAENIDQNTLEALRDFRIRDIWEECHQRGGTMELCGYVPVSVGLLLAKKRNLDIDILKYAHSGDVTGDNSRVVGYFSAVLYPKERNKSNSSQQNQDPAPNSSLVKPVDALTLEQKRSLIEIAQKTIHAYVMKKEIFNPAVEDERLKKVEGAFVTVHKNGGLRGCIGNIIGRQPLYLTVRDMAISAVSQDPRFAPVTPQEMDQLDIEVSVLSRPVEVKDPKKIVMGVHGVIVRQGMFHQGVFLPQVATETGWNREQFLSNLCSHKAGLPPDAWKDPKTQIEIFTADVFSEADVK